MWHNVKLLNKCANILFVIVGILIALEIAFWVLQKPIYAIKTIKVKSEDSELTLKHVNAQTIRSFAMPYIRGNFFTVNLEEVKNAFEMVPWVRVAGVRREWPDKLVVSIEEYKPLGIWGNEGQLLSTKGDLFTVNLAEVEEDYELLKFSGPEGSEKEVFTRFCQLTEQFQKVQLKPVEVKLSSRYAWSVKLNNQMKVIYGRETEKSAVLAKTENLLNVFSQLKQMTGGRLDTIDMRYANGLAIKTSG